MRSEHERAVLEMKNIHVVAMKVLGTLVVIMGCLPVSLAQNSSQLITYDAHLSGNEVVTGLTFGSYKLTTGTARVIKSPADLNKVESGDIIVTVMTQESWQHSLKKSAGIITNIGDGTCHAAVFGKKNAIPVLVGAGNATEKIIDGHVIIMDCSHGRGRVYKSEDKKEAPVTAYTRHDYSAVA